MRRNLILSILLMFSAISFSQSKLGDVACVYVTTTDLDSSTALYEKLGFKKVNSNTYPVPWAQVSDGSLLIMMRKDATPYIGLTYYSNDLDKKIAQLEKDGVEFSQKPKETDPVKRYLIKSPDGFNIVLSNNLGGFSQPTGMTMLNMKPEEFKSAENYPNKQCGVFGEFCHPVVDLENSISFWKKLGFELKANLKQPYSYAILSDGLMIVSLHQTKEFNYPAVAYFGLNTENRVEQLKKNGVKNFKEMMGKNNVILTTWEGQHVFLFSMVM